MKRRCSGLALIELLVVVAITGSGRSVAEADPPVEAPRPQTETAVPGPEVPSADELLAKLPARKRTPETEAMIRAIASGEMGPNQGWYKPGQSRFGWDWLRARYDADEDAAITRDEFTGPAETFARLDRDRNRQIQQDDFDWSDQSPWMQELQQATRLFRRLDDSSDGRLDREEWLAAFERLSAGEDTATPEALRDLLFPPSGPGERPSLDVLIEGLISGEIGSHMAGPAVGDPAPDFELRTHDGERLVRLSEFRGSKPVVLVFGSFT